MVLIDSIGNFTLSHIAAESAEIDAAKGAVAYIGLVFEN